MKELEKMNNLGTRIQKWVLRFIKYNIVGVAVWLITAGLYYMFFFPVLGGLAYILVSIIGGVLQFTLISFFNKTKLGIMFESSMQKDNHPKEK